MSEKLQITVKAEGTVGRIDIIGSISEWNQNCASDFREKCQALKDGGVASCKVYLMTVGGDCFQANEIVNILIDVFKTYTGEGGAIVASAGTYIAVNASSFELAKNGQFMIHKPWGDCYGNEDEIAAQLRLLQNMSSTYYEAYAGKCKKTKAELDAKWNGGDFWMTAQEALDWGFITSIKDPVKIDQAAASAIRASGSPIQVTIDKPTNDVTMADLKAQAIALGLPESATEEQINATIADNAKKAKEYDTMKAAADKKAKEDRANEIKALLDKAEQEKRIKADARPQWQKMLEDSFDNGKELLGSIQPVQKLSATIKPSVGGVGATTYQGKTFEQLQDEAPELLATLQDENPEAYDTLFADYKKRNKIK
jgi:ATP-dependent protease ClpP protease subunit/ParB-like chromosome segregation protein Spo0J